MAGANWRDGVTVTDAHSSRRAPDVPTIEDTQPGVTEALDALVEPLTRGDPHVAAAVDVQEPREVDGGLDRRRAGA